MILIIYVLITIPPVYTYSDISNLFVVLLFPSIGFSVMVGVLFNKSQVGYANSTSIGSKLFVLVWAIIFGGIPWASIVLPLLLQDYVYLITYIFGLLCIFGLTFCLIYLPKRTSYGNEMLGKLKGFRNFLETAEKTRLESMVMTNPTYFYDILPYAYVLGVSDKWIKQFETISLQAPGWYDSPNAFNIIVFGLFMNSTMKSAQRTMSSSPSSGSGGSGGGGGGSW